MSEATPQQQRQDIRQAGFLPGESAGHVCSDCGRGCGRGWWVRTSYEYNEWEGYCRECAYRYAHKWDHLQEGQQ